MAIVISAGRIHVDAIKRVVSGLDVVRDSLRRLEGSLAAHKAILIRPDAVEDIGEVAHDDRFHGDEAKQSEFRPLLAVPDAKQ